MEPIRMFATLKRFARKGRKSLSATTWATSIATTVSYIAEYNHRHMAPWELLVLPSSGVDHLGETSLPIKSSYIHTIESNRS